MDRENGPDIEHHRKGLDLVLQVMRLLRDPRLGRGEAGTSISN